MNYPIILITAALALGTAAFASPALRRPASQQHLGEEKGSYSTKTPQGSVELGDANAGWLHLTSSDQDDDEEEDEDCEDDEHENDCDAYNRNGGGPATGPQTPPQNGLFTTGKAPVVKSN
jgi:hypothetical protein